MGRAHSEAVKFSLNFAHISPPILLLIQPGNFHSGVQWILIHRHTYDKCLSYFPIKIINRKFKKIFLIEG